MVSAKIKITNQEGLHLRPATNLCKEAVKYKAKVTLQIRNTTANAKSILNILAAQVKQGDEVLINCDGEDEKEALEAISALAKRNMDMEG